MRRIALDTTLSRAEHDGFVYPLGAVPVKEGVARPGYVWEFEPADTGAPEGAPELDGFDDGSDWEDWPDRFMFDICISATRVRSLARTIFSLLPGRVFPIVDVLGNDAYRAVDPLIAYELIGIEKFLDLIGFYRDWLFEDGLVGFGAMSLSPFFYVFIDEHKLITVRVPPEMKEKLEKILAAYDLEATTELRTIDSVEHEHRSVVHAPITDHDLMTAEEAIEHLRDEWRLQLNVDGRSNVDDDGNALGLTGWRCVVRCSAGDPQHDAYAEVFLAADCLDDAERLATEAATQGASSGAPWDDVMVVAADRLLPEEFASHAGLGKAPMKPGVAHTRWHRSNEHAKPEPAAASASGPAAAGGSAAARAKGGEPRARRRGKGSRGGEPPAPPPGGEPPSDQPPGA